MLAHIVVPALRFGGQNVVSRLLLPSQMGIMSLVNSVRSGLELFSDTGVEPNIVQSERGDEPVFLDTAFTVQVIRGLLVFLVACGLSPFLADWYGEPQLQWLLPAVSITALLSGFTSTKWVLSERHFRLGRVALIEILAQVLGTGTMVVWALVSPTIWSLVAAAVMGAITELVLSYALLEGYSATFGWERAAARSLLSFGKWILLSTAIFFAVGEADRLILGAITRDNMALLGMYHVAASIAKIPGEATASLASKVMLPLFSRARLKQGDFSEPFSSARRLVLIVSGFVLSGLIGGGPAAIRLVYDARYHDGAGWMLQAIALGMWFAAPGGPNNSALLAKGEPRFLAFTNFAKLVALGALVPLGAWQFGFPGAVMGFALAELFRYATCTWGIYRIGLKTVKQDLGFTVVVAVASIGCWFAGETLHARGFHPVVQALAVFAVASLIWSPWLARYAHYAIDKLRNRLGR